MTGVMRMPWDDVGLTNATANDVGSCTYALNRIRFSRWLIFRR
jgi:hypothetical protein